MTDTLLVDAVAALKTKIESSAATATPEELAYLGTAIDRIGGRATVLEVVVLGDQKKTELTALAATKTAEATDAIEAVKTAAIDFAETTLAEATDAIEAVKTAAIDFAETTLAEATDAIGTVKTAAISEVNDAIVDMQNAAGQFSQQLFFGRKTYFYGQI